MFSIIQANLENRFRLTLSTAVAFGRRLPVDDTPDGAEVLSLAVLVLGIVGVLPSIDTNDWPVLAYNRVLILQHNFISTVEFEGPGHGIQTGKEMIWSLLVSLSFTSQDQPLP